MKPIVIGITGPKRAGKDTAARIIRQCLAEYDQELYIGQVYFADPMYDMLAAFVGRKTVERLRHSDVKDTEIIEPFGCTLRHMAQTLGTEWGRNLIHNNAWVLSIHRKIEAAAAQELPENTDGVVVIIPDVRFPNEAEYVNNNGFLLHISRPDVVKAGETHESENGVDTHENDCVIHNDSDYDTFEQKVYDYGRGRLRDELTAAVQASAGNGQLLSV